MSRRSNWKEYYEARDVALRKGEQISEVYGFNSPPVDPFRILNEERGLIHAVGEDFGKAFDGRIKYIGPRFLLCFNTVYDRWSHSGQRHSKVLFSIGHELGHFFLDHHRRCLVTNREPHDSFSEFTSGTLVETEADHFSAGLLMPARLMRRFVNRTNFPQFGDIRAVCREFEVSLTGLLARWTQLSDFPTATIATRDGRIEFGWVSEAFNKRGCYKVRRGHFSECQYFKRFQESNAPVTHYQQGEGAGSTDYWLEWDHRFIDTVELYFAIPHTGYIWVFLMCDEEVCADDRFDD